MKSEPWPLEDVRAAAASVDFDRFVLDCLAAASAAPAVVVSVGGDPANDVGAALAALPVVAIAAGAGGDSWDVVVDDPDPVLAGVRAAPMAAVVAAQTLRLGDRHVAGPADTTSSPVTAAQTPRLGDRHLAGPTDTTSSPVAAAQTRRPSAGFDTAGALTAESLAYATLQAGPEHARWLAAQGRRVRRDRHQARIEVSDLGSSITITLNRPRLRNLLDTAMRDELVDVLKALAAGADDRPVVITGAGGNFCAGGDPAEFGTAPDPVTAHLIRGRAGVAPWLAALAHRATAEIDGACVGAGVELAAFCARVVATERARFRLPELSMGLIPGAGGTVSLPARIGRQRTLEWLLTNASLNTATAREWGLVDEIS